MQHAILEKSIYPVTVRYIVLNVLSMAGMSLYLLADTYFVANGVGQQGLVALNLAIPIYSFVTGIGMLLGVGGATQYAISTGRGEQERGSRIFTQTLAVGLATGVLFTLAGIFAPRQIAGLLGADGESAPLAATYLATVLCFASAFIVNNILAGFVRNDGQPRLAMAAMLTASFSNIIMDYICIYPLRMGIFGAAFATGLAQLFSIGVLVLHFRGTHNHLRLVRCKPDGTELWRSITAGVPSFVSELSSGLVILLFNMAALGLAGNAGVAAYGVIANVALVCVSVFNGIGNGIQPVLSVCYGAGKPDKTMRGFLVGCVAAVVFGVVFYALAGLFPHVIVSWFNGEGDATMAQLAERGIQLYFTAFLPMGLNIAATSFFASTNRPGGSVTLSVLRGLGLTAVMVLTLPNLIGMDGVWLAVPIAETVTLVCAVVLVWRVLRRERREQAVKKV